MRTLTAVLAGLMLSVPAASQAAVLNDEVTSAKIKEADNTASQDTNSGSGVKTGHLQNKAVTNAKLADGAVTDAKISGVISTTKLSVGTGAGMVAAGNHTHATYQKKYAEVIVVAKAGGDFDTVSAALASITDASAAKPYLVKVMPGVYGDALMFVPANVTVEGSGMDLTTINAEFQLTGGTLAGLTATNLVVAYNGAVVREARVAVSTYYLAFNVAEPNVRIVDSIIEGAPGVEGALHVSTGGFTLERSTVRGAQFGLHFGGEGTNLQVTVVDSDVSGTDAPFYAVVRNSVVDVRNSKVAGATLKASYVYNDPYANNLQLRLANCQVAADLGSFQAGIDKLVNAYDGAFNAIPDL